MGVKVEKNFGKLADQPLSSKELMRQLGLLARERIIRRTLAGQDQNENAFAPYSASYAATKLGGLGGFGVNLQVSGAMLNAITIIELTEESVTLGFAS